MSIYLILRKCLNLLLVAMLVLPAVALKAEEQSIPPSIESGIGLGYAVVRFDASVKFKNKQRNQSVFVDAEGTLGLPDWDAIQVLYGNYRFTNKHAIGFSYFQVRRESLFVNFDETLEDV